MLAEPQDEHRWLQKLIGEWTFENECSMGPGQPLTKFRGSENVRSLGGLWVLCEGRGEMPGGGIGLSLMTLGYDPAVKRYVGTFVGPMTHLWIYEGSLNAAGTTLTLETEGPSFAGDGKTAKYRDVIEFKSDTHRMLTSHTLSGDGTWHGFMTANYHKNV